jgi:AcrR family transcriptional regulator
MDRDAGALASSKADLRRAQVLEAAASCFNREGFHGASMASIAEEASLSVGQIYRYFANKDAVIEALVEQSMEDWSLRMADIKARGGSPADDIVDVMRFHLEKTGDSERAALGLEFVAEAARNPRIRAIVQHIDRSVREQLTEIIIRGGIAADSACSRVGVIISLMDGWSARAVKDPGSNGEIYLETLRPVIEHLLSGEARAAAAR